MKKYTVYFRKRYGSRRLMRVTHSGNSKISLYKRLDRKFPHLEFERIDEVKRIKRKKRRTSNPYGYNFKIPNFRF